MEIVMESIQELLRKLCKCIVKSDDGYKINIELEKSDPGPSPDPDPKPDPEIDPNSPEAKFDPNIPLFIENAQDIPISFCMSCHSESVNNRNISYSYDNITWQPLIFTKESSSDPYMSDDIILYRKGDRAYFKGEAADGLVSGTIDPARFVNARRGIPSKCCVDVGGNITSLFYGKDDKFKTDYLDLSNITHTSSKSMIGTLFGGANSNGLHSYIRIPPALPATTLCPGCYEAFFYLDTDLVDSARLEYIPVLPAKKLETDCYKYMFYSESYLSVTDKTDKFYCFKILGENAYKLDHMADNMKYIQVNNPNIIGSLNKYKYGIIYCPIDPGSKLPAGWKWVKIPPME